MLESLISQHSHEYITIPKLHFNTNTDKLLKTPNAQNAGTISDDNDKISFLTTLAIHGTNNLAVKLDRIVENSCSKRELRENKKIESFLQKKPQCRPIVMVVRAVLLHMMGTEEEVRGLLLSSQNTCSKALVSSWIGPSKLLKWLGKKLQFVGRCFLLTFFSITTRSMNKVIFIINRT